MLHCVAAFCFARNPQPDSTHHSFEIASVLVRLDHVASFIVNANHGIISMARVFLLTRSAVLTST